MELHPQPAPARAGSGPSARSLAAMLDGVSLSRGGKAVLRDVTLSLEPAEFVGMLGPNGAGKTTLFRALLGLLPATAGRIEVLGRRPARGNPDIGYMPQSRSAMSGLRLSGRDFVAGVVRGHRWGLPLLGRDGAREVDWALEAVGGRDLAARPLRELSGGQRQRLLLAQALVGRPRLLLLDEPLMSLDPHHQRGVVELVRSVQRTLGITVVFSAHELNPLLGHVDRVLYLGSGAAAIGSVDEVITGPVLSRLYGSAIDVVHVGSRIFVMSGACDAERDEHRHDEDGHHHDGHREDGRYEDGHHKDGHHKDGHHKDGHHGSGRHEVEHHEVGHHESGHHEAVRHGNGHHEFGHHGVAHRDDAQHAREHRGPARHERGEAGPAYGTGANARV